MARLDGMFAFALYDSAIGRLLLARDRAGEKPLFYRHEPGRLAFASELKALMADPRFPRDLDLHALDHYLAYGYVPGTMCILRGMSPSAAMAHHDMLCSQRARILGYNKSRTSNLQNHATSIE